MLDVCRMAGNGSVELLTRQRSAFDCLRVVVFEAQHPFSGRRFRCSFAQRLQDVGNGAQIAIHHAQVRKASLRGMRVRIDEAGQHRLSAQIKFFRIAGGERQQFVIRSDGEKSSAGNGHGLRSRLTRIDCPDVSVVKNKFGLGAVDGKQVSGKHRERSDGTHTVHKLTTRSWHLYSFYESGTLY